MRNKVSQEKIFHKKKQMSERENKKLMDDRSDDGEVGKMTASCSGMVREQHVSIFYLIAQSSHLRSMAGVS